MSRPSLYDLVLLLTWVCSDFVLGSNECTFVVVAALDSSVRIEYAAGNQSDYIEPCGMNTVEQ